MISENFVLVGAVISFIGGLSYLADTVRGKSRPHPISWFMWALAPLVATVAEIQAGVGIIALTTFMAGFMPLLIFLSSFLNRKAVWKATAFDYFCGFLSLLGFGLWLYTGEGNLAIAFSIIADFMAAVPSLIKSYHHPETESWFAYFCVPISASITLLTIKEWTFAHYAFPIYLLVIGTVFTVLIVSKIGTRGLPAKAV